MEPPSGGRVFACPGDDNLRSPLRGRGGPLRKSDRTVKKNKSGSPRSKPEVSNLPDAELEVLACLWNRKAATARQVREQMADYRPMAHGSVLTLLKRLLEKGLVTREKATAGKAFVYRPALPAAPTYRRILDDLVQRIFGGSGLTLVSSLFETRAPTPDEVDQLEALLDKCRADARQRAKKK